MSSETVTLTPAQEQLVQHLNEGGRVARDTSKPEGQGFSAAGIKVVQPNTAQKLIELGHMELLYTSSGYEFYAAPQPEPVEPEAPKFDDSALEQVRNGKKKSQKAEAPRDPIDILMWVGSMHYPTIDDFVAEAQEQGVCKRISRFPSDLVPGESRIFFAHDEGQIGDAVIFGYATVTGLEVLYDPEIGQPEGYSRDDIAFVDITELNEAERGCGYRVDHNARYAISLERRKPTPQPDREAYGPLMVLNEPLDYNSVIEPNAKRFRSYRRVDGDALLASEARKERPVVRARQSVHAELPPELEDLEIGRRWSDPEREALKAMVERYNSKAQAFRDFSIATGRSLQGVSYQWYQRIRHEGDE